MKDDEGKDMRAEIETEGGVISHSAGGMRVRADGPSWIQIEHGFGKSAVLVLWLSAFVSALAVIGLVVALTAYRNMTAHVNVLQYDLAAVKAQLIDQGLYDPTSH